MISSQQPPVPTQSDRPSSSLWLEVSLQLQQLKVVRDNQVEALYQISTARNGAGEQEGSGCTPRGWHKVRARIGTGLAAGAVLVGRRPTGEIYSDALASQFPQRDWILSRILWLSGLEPGRNRLGAQDTMRRFIYIHGTPDSEPMGVPLSHGCVRMRNADVIELYDLVPAGTPVLIR